MFLITADRIKIATLNLVFLAIYGFTVKLSSIWTCYIVFANDLIILDLISFNWRECCSINTEKFEK